MKFCLVNNYTRKGKIAKPKKTIKELNAGSDVRVNLIDAVILRRLECMLSKCMKECIFRSKRKLMRKQGIQMVSLCFGHMLIAMAHESDVVGTKPSDQAHHTTKSVIGNDIFDRIESNCFPEYNREKVKTTKNGFTKTAWSKANDLPATKSSSQIWHSAQFYQEAWNSKRKVGELIVENFKAVLI